MGSLIHSVPPIYNGSDEDEKLTITKSIESFINFVIKTNIKKNISYNNYLNNH